MNIGPLVIGTYSGIHNEIGDMLVWTGKFVSSPEYTQLEDKVAVLPENERKAMLEMLVGDAAIINLLGYSVPDYVKEVIISQDGTQGCNSGNSYPELDGLHMTDNDPLNFRGFVSVCHKKVYLSALRSTAVKSYRKNLGRQKCIEKHNKRDLQMQENNENLNKNMRGME